MLTIVLVVLLVLFLAGGGFASRPAWRDAHGPTLGGVLGLLLFVVVVLLVLRLVGVLV